MAYDGLTLDWPGEETINHLILKARGLFIYAATVCFIEENGEYWAPHDLLRGLRRGILGIGWLEKWKIIFGLPPIIERHVQGKRYVDIVLVAKCAGC